MFTLVFPCFITHIHKVKIPLGLFLKEHDIVRNSTIGKINLINQIIIIFNGVLSKRDKEFNSIISEIKNSINIIDANIKFDYKLFREQLNPGIARNKSYDLITNDYIVFHDSDDDPHPYKLSIIRDMFLKTDVDQLHHLIFPTDLNFINYKHDSNFSFNIDYVKINNNEFINEENIVLSNKIIGPVSHGLISIKKSKLLEIEWCNLRGGEDRKFVLESMKMNNKIYIIKGFLSSYEKYKINRFKNHYSDFYKLFDKKI